MPQIKFWGYTWAVLCHAAMDCARFLAKDVLYTVLMTLATIILGSYVWKGILNGLACFGIVCLLILLYFIIRTPYRMHIEQENRLDELRARAGLAPKDLAYDMDGWEVMEYAVEHSGLTSNEVILRVLWEGAVSGRIHIKAKSKVKQGSLPVSPSVIKDHDLKIEPRNEKLREKLGLKNKMLYEDGFTLYEDGLYDTRHERGWHPDQVELKFVRPEIEALWPRRR